MKKISLFIFLSWVITAFAFGQNDRQIFNLKPGWNAIYLEVQPNQNKISEVFEGIPVISVWKWNNSKASIELIQDPNELVPEQKEWNTYFKDKPSFMTNLFTINGGNCYLLKINGNEDVVLTISGKPVLPKIKWISDSFNLVGFHLEPGNEPLFKRFFDYSPSHKDQTIYRLIENKWEIIQNPDSTQMKSGEAFWVYCNGGPSEFVGPLKIELEQYDELDFGQNLLEQKIHITNLSNDSNLTFKNMGNIPFKYWVPITVDNPGWNELPNIKTFSMTDDKYLSLRISVDRSKMNSFKRSASSNSSLIEVTDDNGMRLRFISKASQNDYKGLWVGHVIVNKVDENSQKYSPSPTDSELQFRIIIHVDEDENVNLLKEVTQMWDSNNSKYVLVTDYSKLHNYSGAALRNGELVGRRISSVIFGFDGIKKMEGEFGFDGVLNTHIDIHPSHPTNPYYHKFHPDHNNLDEDYVSYKQESFHISRTITLKFIDSDPDFSKENSIGWGDTVLGGKYEEIIHGLHKDSIQVEGSFRIQKVSSISQIIN